MICNMYAVKDELSGEFMIPTIIKNDDMAKRQFKTQINTIELWRENPSDYSLFKLGTYNDETGIIESHLEKIVGGRSVLNA